MGTYQDMGQAWRDRELQDELDDYLEGDWSEESLVRASEEMDAILKLSGIERDKNGKLTQDKSRKTHTINTGRYKGGQDVQSEEAPGDICRGL